MEYNKKKLEFIWKVNKLVNVRELALHLLDIKSRFTLLMIL